MPGNGRAWELVTSEEPVSAFLERLATGFASPSGGRIFYTTQGKLPDAPMQEQITLMASATRGASGWVNATLPEPSGRYEPFVRAANQDLSEGIVTGYTGGASSLLRFGLEGSWTELAAAETPGEMPLIGASEDLRRDYFSSSAHLVPADAARTSGRSIYESDAAGIHLVDADAEGHLLSTCGSTSAAGPGISNGAVSRNGRRIYFTTHPGCAGPARVYLAEAGAPAVDISASRCDLADCGPEADVELAAVTPDGSSALLLTTQRLTDDDTDSNVSLYRYDVDTGALSLLTPSSAEISPISQVLVSEDGSHVYFLSGFGQSKPLDEVDARGLHQLPLAAGDNSYGASSLQISSDGNVVAFESNAALLPEDTDSAGDVYRYDLRSETLTLASPGGNGDRPVRFMLENESMPLAEPPDGPDRAMSADGSRIFFTTAEALLPEDHNELDDVYEWADGGLSLVSSGAGTDGAFLDGVVPDGSSVFFTTGDTLLPRDRDGGNRDIYAARIGGGFPEPSPAASCDGDACRNAVLPPPARPAAASAMPGKRMVIGRIGAADRRRMAVTGWIALMLEAPRSGPLRAAAKARLGGRPRVVAKARVKVARPGPLRLRMRLSRQARARLAAGRRLRLRLRLRLRGVPPENVRIDLRGRR
ncbi:MAG TPA: hypothetical protein VFK14_12685 [Solirubrobacterales bacterium]|nr:hypothetical protein [Solirubrobacterales bacterium]